VVAREQSSVQQLVVEEVESVESAAVEQQQEHGHMQVVKPVEQQEEKHAVSSSNGNGKAKQEKKDSSETTSQGSPAKSVPQAKTVRNLVFVTSEVSLLVSAVISRFNCLPGLRAGGAGWHSRYQQTSLAGAHVFMS
jgi:hypothetical protein